MKCINHLKIVIICTFDKYIFFHFTHTHTHIHKNIYKSEAIGYKYLLKASLDTIIIKMS